MPYDDDRPDNLPAGAVGDAIYVAAKKYGMDPRVLGGIASIESSFQPISNYNRPTQYKGLFQMGYNEWRQYGNGNIYNAYDNADAAARMLSDHSDWFRHSYGRDPRPAEVYMMHQQGRGFFSDGAMTNIGGNPYPGMRGPQNSSSFMNGWGRELERRMNGAPETARIPIDFSAFGSDPGEKQPIDFAAFGRDPQRPQAQQSKPIDFAAFGAQPTQQAQKLTESSLSNLKGLGEAAQALTPHADWKKFEGEATPSQNVEDKRDPDYTSARHKREAPMMPELPAGEDTFASSDRTQDLSDVGLTVPKGGPLQSVPLPRVRPASAPQLPDQQRQALDISDAVPRRPAQSTPGPQSSLDGSSTSGRQQLAMVGGPIAEQQVQQRLRDAREDVEPEQTTDLDYAVGGMRGRYNRGRERVIDAPPGDSGIMRPPETLDRYEGEQTSFPRPGTEVDASEYTA